MRSILLKNITFFNLLTGFCLNGMVQQQATFNIGAGAFELNSKPDLIRCGEMHFARKKGQSSHKQNVCSEKNNRIN